MAGTLKPDDDYAQHHHCWRCGAELRRGRDDQLCELSCARRIHPRPTPVPDRDESRPRHHLS